MHDIGIIILAAGKSQRMGAPKQLLNIGENSLIQHVVKIAVVSDYAPIVVVLGSNFEKIKKEITDFEVFPVLNNNWEKGMGTSIAKGIQEIQNLNPDLRAVIILLVDQPLLRPNLLYELVKLYKKTRKKIVASKYDKTIGVPALFDRSIFEELENLGEKNGAKKLIQKFMEKEKAAFVNFPEGRLDLDTPEHYQRYLKEFGEK